MIDFFLILYGCVILYSLFGAFKDETPNDTFFEKYRVQLIINLFLSVPVVIVYLIIWSVFSILEKL